MLTEEQWKKLDRIDQYDLEPLRLNDLIGKFEAVDKDKLVKILYSDDSIAYPNVLERFIGHCDKKYFTCFASWRGRYENLSIDISKNEKKVTVGNFLEQCKHIIGKQLYGYKGGLFQMDGSKVVYASEASEGYKCAIFDVIEKDNEVHLIAKRYLCGWF